MAVRIYPLIFALILLSVPAFAASASGSVVDYAVNRLAAALYGTANACPQDGLTYVDCSGSDRAATEWVGEDGCKYACKASVQITATASTGTAESACPQDGPIKVDCSGLDRSKTEWVGPDGCKYACSSQGQKTCQSNSPIYEDCSKLARAQKSWYDENNCLHICNADNPCASASAADSSVPSCKSGTQIYKYTDANGCLKYECKPVQKQSSCKNPPVPASCFDGTGAGAYIYKDANGCFQYGCKLGKCAFDSKPKVVDCTAADADRPEAEFWWDSDGCLNICSSSPLASWTYSAIGNLCIDHPELSFTGYFPNPSFYPEAYVRDSIIQKAAKVMRIEKRCSDDSVVKKYELYLKAFDVNGKQQTYCNFVCRNRYYEQCILDGSFDSYVDEWCVDASGNRITVPVPDYSNYQGAKTVSAPAASADGAKATSATAITAPVPTAASATGTAPVQAAYTLKLSTGWNMVSVPLDASVPMSGAPGSCGLLPYAWRYAPTGYVKETALAPGAGYWVKAASACSIPISGNRYAAYSIPLSAGWNLIGALESEISISDYANDCRITSGPWYYSRAASSDNPQYVQSSVLAPGKAYWIKVGAACTLQSREAMPPSPP